MELKVKRNILLNPGPATTTDSVKFAQVVPDICPREQEFGDMVHWIQEKLVSFVGTPETHVCVLMGGSGTAAVETTVSSVIPKDGALLVVNNGAYAARIIKMTQIHDISLVDFESSTHEAIDYEKLHRSIVGGREALRKNGKRLTHIAVVHHETTSGLLNDISKLGELCAQENISLIVDAMSSYGAMPINMGEDNIDYLISSSNKNLQGMAGIGIIICKKEALESTKDIPNRSLYLNLYDQYAHFLKTKQFRFTPPVQTMYALKQAVIETIAETIEVRHKRYLNCYRTLREGMTDLGFKVLVPDEISSGFITTFFDPRDARYSFETMHDYLYERGFTIYPGKVSEVNTFRLANIGDLDVEDIQSFLDCFKSYLLDMNIEKI